MTPRARRWIRDNALPVILIVLLVTSFRSAVADWNVVPTGSMNPTIVEGDRIFVNKLAYGLRVPFTMWRLAEWADPQRGDVVVFRSPQDGKQMVKRVVALPGETVAMVDNLLYINGRPADVALAEPGCDSATARGGRIFAIESLGGAAEAHPIVVTPSLPARRSFPPMTVPPDHYFVLGDNRDNSGDSRYFGFLPRANITGRSSHVIYSLDAESGRLPRWERTLERLP